MVFVSRAISFISPSNSATASVAFFLVLRLLWRGSDTALTAFCMSQSCFKSSFKVLADSFVQVWQGRDKQTNEKVAVKFEDINMHIMQDDARAGGQHNHRISLTFDVPKCKGNK